MKVRVLSTLPRKPFSTPGVFVVSIVTKDDDVGFTTYELQAPAGTQLTLTSGALDSAAESGCNHVYYGLEGESRAFVTSDMDKELDAGSLLALTSDMSATLTTATAVRIAVVYVSPPTTEAKPTEPIFQTLSAIIGTDRDVDWQRGRSRRFLTKADGFGLSFHNTICSKGNVSPLWYKRNVELAYFIHGDVTYKWDDGKCQQTFRQDDVSGGDACAMLMDKNDPHELHALSQDSEALCVFYPPLLGHETHDFSKKGFSSF